MEKLYELIKSEIDKTDIKNDLEYYLSLIDVLDYLEYSKNVHKGEIQFTPAKTPSKFSDDIPF